jgi:hypothetical protein
VAENDYIMLAKGSRYRITSMETRDRPLITHGVFRGYAAIGPDDGICVELDASHAEMAGKVRIIPSHMIISIDVVEQAEEKKQKEKPGTMYG